MPAGLAAAAAVAAAPRGHARQQAGARVAVAQGAVDEGLELQPVRLERGDLVEAELTRQDGAREAQVGQRRELGARVRVELRAGVQLEPWVRLAHERGEAQVGDDQRVEAGPVRRLQRREGRLELVVLEQHVQGQVARARRTDGRARWPPADASRVEVAGEGARAPARRGPRVDGVGAGRQGRLQGGGPPAGASSSTVGRRDSSAARRPGVSARRRAGAGPAQSAISLPRRVAPHADEARGGDDLDAAPARTRPAAG